MWGSGLYIKGLGLEALQDFFQVRELPRCFISKVIIVSGKRFSSAADCSLHCEMSVQRCARR